MMLKKVIKYSTFFLFIVTASIFALYNYFYYSTIPAYEKKLTAMVHERAQEINNYLNQQEKNAVKLSSEATILDAFSKKENSAQRNPSTGSGRAEEETLLAAHKELMGFSNVFLIDKTGTIIFSTAEKIGVGTNITEHTTSSLGTSYERAAMTLTNDFSSFNFNELLQEPALFITIPILHEKKFIGTLTYQLDEEKIYLIAHQYIGLEKTGEVVLACKDGSSIIFVAPTRNDPDVAFKKRAISANKPLPIQHGALGQNGSGIATDYRDQQVVSAWQFIPKLDWGMDIKIDLHEILQSADIIYNIFILCLMMLILSIFCTIYLFYQRIRHRLHAINTQFPCNKIPSVCKNPMFIILLLVVGCAAKNIILCKKDELSAIQTAKHKAIETTTDNAEAIETILTKIQFVAQSIANDLHSNYLKKDDIATRINRDFKENSIFTEISVIFTPYSYDPNIELYAQTTGSSETVNSYKTKWYTQAIEKNSVWLIDPMQHEHEHITKPTGAYACTFLDQAHKVRGVVAITFSLTPIIHTAEYDGIGQTGYSIIMTDDGRFIFHPLAHLAYSETTLLQYAQSQGNSELATVAQKVTAGKPVMASYNSENTNERMWIYTHPIKPNNWIIGTIFSQDEISVSSDTLRHYYFWILILLTLSILLILALACRYTLFSLSYYIIIANAILVIALLTTWYIIKRTTTVNRESRTIITDQSALNKFLNDLNDEASRKHENPPITVPSGILLYSLSNTGPDSVTLSGYLWNKYNTQVHTDIIRGMDLPQATRMAYGTPILSVADHEETSTWNIQGVMYQEQKYAKFPFDQQELRIMLEHKDIEKNIILTPDLTAYKKLSPESTPGLSKEFSLSGFTIEQAFFEYQKVEPKANFGFKEYGKVTDNYHLIYNAIIHRNLINPFVIYLLPLLVILFTLFAILLIIKKTSLPLSIIGAHSGLFFALIVLQRSMREQYPSGSTLYMEYAFFYTYITIILLIIHTILMFYYKRWEKYQDRSLYLMRILFWPFQWITWLITTVIIFY